MYDSWLEGEMVIMRKPTRQEMNTMVRQLRPWFKRMNIPESRFWNMDTYWRVFLHEFVYKRTRDPNEMELNELDKQLITTDVRGKDHSIEDKPKKREELMEKFMPSDHEDLNGY